MEVILDTKKHLVGVYCIKNTINNKVYIGSSVNLQKRITRHLTELKNFKHSNKYLEKSYHKYGPENFQLFLLEECNIESLIDKEIYYINLFNSLDKTYGYNLSIPKIHPTINSNDSYRKILSLAKKGRKPKNYLEMLKTRWKKVRVYKNDLFYKDFNSYNEAERDLGITKGYIHSYFRSNTVQKRKFSNLKFEKLWK